MLFQQKVKRSNTKIKLILVVVFLLVNFYCKDKQNKSFDSNLFVEFFLKLDIGKKY